MSWVLGLMATIHRQTKANLVLDPCRTQRLLNSQADSALTAAGGTDFMLVSHRTDCSRLVVLSSCRGVLRPPHRRLAGWLRSLASVSNKLPVHCTDERASDGR